MKQTFHKPTRRVLLKASVAGALGLAGCWPNRPKENEQSQKEQNYEGLTLRWLGWEHYDVPELREEFETRHGVKVRAGYFDGNSEAYTRLQTGGTKDFDLVMADGFWPRLYQSKGLTIELDEQLLNLGDVFPAFKMPNYELLHDEESLSHRIAAPNCWGGYGITANLDHVHVDADKTISLQALFDSRYSRHISTSARFEENIALAGILAATRLGTKNGPRPGGGNFNPYNLTVEELDEAKRLLIQQKELLLTRWNDEDTLERLLESQAVWLSPEWSGIFRRIHFKKLAGESELNLQHYLAPQEGGLGWVDTWCITSGAAEDPRRLDLSYKWINFRLEKQNMVKIARDIGWSPTVDVISELEASGPLGRQYVETLFLEQTHAIDQLYQFDVPSSPEAWERVWTEVEAA